MPRKGKKAPEDGPAYYPHPETVQERMNKLYPWHEWRIDRHPVDDLTEAHTGKKICAYRAFTRLEEGEAEFMVRVSPCAFTWLDLVTSGLIAKLLELRTTAAGILLSEEARQN